MSDKYEILKQVVEDLTGRVEKIERDNPFKGLSDKEITAVVGILSSEVKTRTAIIESQKTGG